MTHYYPFGHNILKVPDKDVKNNKKPTIKFLTNPPTEYDSYDACVYKNKKEAWEFIIKNILLRKECILLEIRNREKELDKLNKELNKVKNRQLKNGKLKNLKKINGVYRDAY